MVDIHSKTEALFWLFMNMILYVVFAIHLFMIIKYILISPKQTRKIGLFKYII